MRALLLIDIQKGLTKRALYNKELFVNTVNSVIKKYRPNNDQIIFVQHQNNQLVPNTAEWEIDESISIDKKDKIFSKDKGDAFTNQALISFLKENNIDDILVGGLVSHGCVMYTCRGGLEKGFNITLLKNGHTCWNADAKIKIKNTEDTLRQLGVSVLHIDDM